MIIAFLDIETGGFSTTKNGVCEIALVVCDEHFNIIETFHSLIKPYPREEGSDELVSYKDDAMAINGLTVEKLINEGIDVVEVIQNFEAFIRLHGIKKIIGHNSNAFDIPRVNHLSERFGSKSYFSIELDDTMKMAKDKLQLPSYSLPNLCAHFGIINTESHSAKGDALATLELYKRLQQLN